MCVCRHRADIDNLLQPDIDPVSVPTESNCQLNLPKSSAMHNVDPKYVIIELLSTDFNLPVWCWSSLCPYRAIGKLLIYWNK